MLVYPILVYPILLYTYFVTSHVVIRAHIVIQAPMPCHILGCGRRPARDLPDRKCSRLHPLADTFAKGFQSFIYCLNMCQGQCVATAATQDLETGKALRKASHYHLQQTQLPAPLGCDRLTLPAASDRCTLSFRSPRPCILSRCRRSRGGSNLPSLVRSMAGLTSNLGAPSVGPVTPTVVHKYIIILLLLLIITIDRYGDIKEF